MPDADETDLMLFNGVRIVAERSRVLLCVIHERAVWVHRSQLREGTDVRARGDRGRLVIPKWLAVDLDLV